MPKINYGLMIIRARWWDLKKHLKKLFTTQLVALSTSSHVEQLEHCRWGRNWEIDEERPSDGRIRWSVFRKAKSLTTGRLSANVIGPHPLDDAGNPSLALFSFARPRDSLVMSLFGSSIEICLLRAFIGLDAQSFLWYFLKHAAFVCSCHWRRKPDAGFYYLMKSWCYCFSFGHCSGGGFLSSAM